MSQELQNQINALKEENDQLNKQMATNSQGVEGLLAQVDAYKGMIHDNTQASLQLRTNLVLFQKQAKQLHEHIETLNKQIADLTSQLENANKKICDLENDTFSQTVAA